MDAAKLFDRVVAACPRHTALHVLLIRLRQDDLGSELENGALSSNEQNGARRMATR